MSTGDVIGGLGLAAAAAACFDGAVALQALEARALPAPAGGVSLGLVRGLVGRPRWLAATGLAILGWPLQVAALALAPLTVVQPALALGLLLLLGLGARLLSEPAGAREVAAAGAIAAGVAMLAWAAPEDSRVHAAPVALTAVLGALAALAALPWPAGRRAAGGVLVLAAGAGYAASALTTKLLADALAGPAWAAAALWAVLSAALAGAALADEMGALQRLAAARVAGTVFVLSTVVPVLLAPLLTDERWGATPLGGGVIVAGLALVAGGTLGLGSAPAVSRLVAGSHAH